MNGISKNLQTIDLTILNLMKMLLQKQVKKTYSALKPEFNNPQKLVGGNLLIFENSLSFELTDFKIKNSKKFF